MTTTPQTPHNPPGNGGGDEQPSQATSPQGTPQPSGTSHVLLTQEQLQQLLNQQTSSSNQISSMFDGQQFISRDVNSLIPFLKDDTNFEGRNLWIDNVETSLESNGSGIRWIGKCEEVLAVPEGHPWTADSATSINCNVNTVVPFATVLTARAADKIVTTLVESAEHSDRRALAKVPDRIITALSAWVYSALKIKIGEKQRTLLTGIEKGDGFELVRKIRVTVDGVTESPLDLLARRKGLLKLEKLEDWNDYKAALLQLIRDWEKAIDDGVVDRYEQFTPFQQREVLRESAHIVHGLDIWMDEERNKDKRIIDVLAYGDVLVKSQKRRLERMKSASAVHAHVGVSGDLPDSQADTDAYYAEPAYKRARGGWEPMRGGKSGSRKGKGKGGAKGKGKGRPKGAGKGKGKGKGRASKGAGKGKGGWPRQWYPQTTWHYGWQPQHQQQQQWYPDDWGYQSWYADGDGNGAGAGMAPALAAQPTLPAADDAAAAYYADGDGAHDGGDPDVQAWADDQQDWSWADY